MTFAFPCFPSNVHFHELLHTEAELGLLSQACGSPFHREETYQRKIKLSLLHFWHCCGYRITTSTGTAKAAASSMASGGKGFPRGLSLLTPRLLITDYSSTFLDRIFFPDCFSPPGLSWLIFNHALTPEHSRLSCRPGAARRDGIRALPPSHVWLCAHGRTCRRLRAKNSALLPAISELLPEQHRQRETWRCRGSRMEPGAEMKSTRIWGCRRGA